MSAIKIHGLIKRFGKTAALNGLELSVPQGSIYGFIGPNGAGKSTAIRILLGLLKKNGGQVKLLGGDPWQDAMELHKRLAYVPSDVQLWDNMTGGEVIDFLGRLRGSYSKERREQFIDRFDLDPTKKCKAYSKGNRQKVALISAFVSDVELLVLDEPTTGLDPLMEGVFQQCIKEARDAGKTVFLSSHILSEVEAVCDQIGVIRGGKVIEEGSMEELKALIHKQEPPTLEALFLNYYKKDAKKEGLR
ncbi:daunorubicin/doxorubicin resistance ATP-binding protein DrrA [Oxobacter pfennigii]|uniref:Daunorubicin/doxorubicin resistance ATP-binding protein DrrA n=1 Tax=Oxobacter pfennigii TaxID=36849 RepID=A0A0P8W2Y5_9CLOT|nr:ABC transporter ATP-binding protein [Oxobacter pfennigii]KPU42927.1 daunorubicin/doxorubicin resistance ATP-binding protein DrrA [Oxobacter pfennigii]